MSIRLFLKFGSKKHLKKLLKRGEIYFASLESFRKETGSINRDDNGEGVLSLKHFRKKDKPILKINPSRDDEIALNLNHGVLRFHMTEISEKALSLYSIRDHEIFKKDYKIDRRMISDKKYEYCVIITNQIEFLYRIKNTLNKRGVIFRGKSIKYLDYDKDQTDLNLFCKSDQYSYQKEFRIVVYNIKSEYYKIEVGSIEDIALIHLSKKLEGLMIS